MQLDHNNLPYHIPALLPQSLQALDLKPDGIYVDATFGGGGHSHAIVERLGSNGHLYSFDQDKEAVDRAFSDERFTMIHGNFRFISNFLRFYGVRGGVDGLLADLGVSFHHFDDPERGFSFRADGPLDMRMNQTARLTAAELLNNAPEEKLTSVLRDYGELRQARRIARAIIDHRSSRQLKTTADLLSVITPYIDPRQEKKELAMTFQALRIEVNGELDALNALLSQSLEVLKPGGRLAIITYHSLEDRLVKNFMKTGSFSGERRTDFFGRDLSPFKLLTSKPIIPDTEETAANPRSRSAKLRVAVKLNTSDNG
ncbi:MAG: 16S rRNA (cytosine(1402)-N(4))-methyltransferase RsmH [Muribaculaceae bacterium]|nr:16S rRNA (cytosine(1402)-N(4))-methyltransferase RsmH [Muribaculaceae bacterium]